jgi:pimeloyl-ACP methyl ester carboxylesterase
MELSRIGFRIICALFLLSRSAWAAPESAFFDANGVKIHYVREGSGEPVVLIHGLYSSASMNWQAPGIFEKVAADHDVIALDLPGHGQSDKPNDIAAYGDQMAEDVILLMDHLQIKKAHIVGYSLGGLIAFELIVDHPDRVLSGALGGMGWMAEGGFLQSEWEHMGLGACFSSTPLVCVHSVGQLALTKEQVLAVKVPMEVIVGDRDPVRKLYVVPLQGVRTDWPVVEIEGAGHITCIMKPAFTDELLRWLDLKR